MITVVGNSVVGNSVSYKITATGISIKGSVAPKSVGLGTSAIIRTGGDGGVYKTVTETKALNRSESVDTYHLFATHECAGDPVSVIIRFDGDDVQYLGKCNVSGRKIEFVSEDDVFGLDCTISYLYSVL